MLQSYCNNPNNRMMGSKKDHTIGGSENEKFRRGPLLHCTLYFVKGNFDPLSGALYVLDWTEKTKRKQPLDVGKWRCIKQLVSLKNTHLFLIVLSMVTIMSL